MIVLPYGDQHVIGRRRRRPRLVSILDAARPAAVGGPAGASATAAAARAPISCAATCTPTTRCSIPALRVFPPVFVVRLPDGAGRAVGAGEHHLRAARRRAPSNASASAVATRLPELVLIEVLRVHLASAPGGRPRLARGAARSGARPGARAAARRARAALDGRRARRRARRCPARCSTSASARCSAARRSATSPSGACTSPRSCSPPPTSASSPIARRVGYDSEEAFSRAFKRAHGASPEPLAHRPPLHSATR